jgi:hypothetical protein
MSTMTTTKIMPDEIINAINDASPLEKCFTGGLLPLELFDRIYNTADEMKRREAEEHRLWCTEKSEECCECGEPMTRQQVALSEQNCLAEVPILEFEDSTDKHFCGVECREINLENAHICQCCGDQAIHLWQDMLGESGIFELCCDPGDETKIFAMGYNPQDLCQSCGDDLEEEYDDDHPEDE